MCGCIHTGTSQVLWTTTSNRVFMVVAVQDSLGILDVHGYSDIGISHGGHPRIVQDSPG